MKCCDTQHDSSNVAVAEHGLRPIDQPSRYSITRKTYSSRPDANTTCRARGADTIQNHRRREGIPSVGMIAYARTLAALDSELVVIPAVMPTLEDLTELFK